jgi:alanyl-tRNA synthetase
MYSTAQIRNKFIAYFKSKQHTEVASSSLIPAEDPTLLFVNAGMVQFKDMFLGAEKRQYTRAVSSQRCVRAGGKHNDLDQVGYTARHHTFFEMLGNFSFGDYFKESAIKYAWDFLTNELKIPADKLLVTVYEKDDEAEKIWIEKIGIPAEKVLRIGAKDNFWQMGDTGPCGPCSEIFYDHGADIAGGPPGSVDEDGDRFIEIWNLVFMQFDKQPDGELLPLPNPCVDTGMGLERITSILQGKHNNYDIDLFQQIINFSIELLKPKDSKSPSLKVIADHIRTCAFLISDGIQPSNEGRGYVLRRIIRRAIRHGHKLGASELFFFKIVSPLVAVMGEAYPELRTNQTLIEATLKKEEGRFAETLETGMAILNKAINDLKGDMLSGAVVFKLYDTFGFPYDLTQDVAREHQLSIDKEGFNKCMQEQKQRSKASAGFVQSNHLPTELMSQLKPTKFTGYESMQGQARIVALITEGKSVTKLNLGEEGIVILDETPFYAESGGQVGDTGTITINTKEIVVYDTQKGAGQFHLHMLKNLSTAISVGDQVSTKVGAKKRGNIRLNHTATHLLHKVLQELLGVHVKQKGSIVSEDKLRFDFSHDDAINTQQLQDIERLVNNHIRSNHTVDTALLSYDEAIKSGAMALFGEKYGEHVRVLNIGDYSIELCGGTHVQATGEIGLFKIMSEASIAAGIRRIEAVTGEVAIAAIQKKESTLNAIIHMANAANETVKEKVSALVLKNKEFEKKIQVLESKLAGNAAQDLWKNVVEENGISYLFEILQNFTIDNMRTIVDNFKSKYPQGIVLLANHGHDDKVQLICSVSKSLINKTKAGDIIRNIAKDISGKGGGRPDFAQGGGVSNLENLKQVINNNLGELKNLINI